MTFESAAHMLQKNGSCSQGLENPESSPSEQESLSWPCMVQGRQGNGQEDSCPGSSRGHRMQISSRVRLEARGLLKGPIQSVSLRPASPSWDLRRSFEKGLFRAGQPHSGLSLKILVSLSPQPPSQWSYLIRGLRRRDCQAA